VQALAAAIEERDHYTHEHTQQLVRLARGVAMMLGLAADHVDRIAHAALLHDVGKLAVPDSILQKPGPLTEDERAMVTHHVEWGYRIVRSIGLTREARWVLHHHERPDGRGYPHGLSGDQIPVASDILHVADAFDALTADRPYRAALPADEALETIEAGAGTEFDSECVDALAACLQSGTSI
jgi:HD-GYP domain-containing protein (c-di-GMP phosphodiesterase class II)